MYSTHGDFDKTEKMVDKLLPALTGLIGSALGFYFGMKNSQSWRQPQSKTPQPAPWAGCSMRARPYAGLVPFQPSKEICHGHI
jgi:hypothetical protein